MWRLATNRMLLPSLAGLGLGAVLLTSTVLANAQDQGAGERYANILADAESLARYNEQMTNQLKSQEAQAALLEQQLAGLDATSAEIVPLIKKMHAELEAFLASDLPFLDPTQAGPDSRQERLVRLRDLMADVGEAEVKAVAATAASAVADPAADQVAAPTAEQLADAAAAQERQAKVNLRNAERFRRLLEAYQIELEYGRTMFAYKGKLDDGREANFVRVGRVTLLYRTADGAEAGYWDAQQKKWVVNNEYAKPIENALLIATKEKAPDLVAVPVPAPQEAPL